MYAVLDGHNFINDIQAVSQIFFPNEGFTVTDAPAGEGVTICSRQTSDGFHTALYVNGNLIGETFSSFLHTFASRNMDEFSRALRMTAAQGVFEVCALAAGQKPPWGLLVGIRPTKIAQEMWDKGRSDDALFLYLTEYYKVSPEKARFCIETAKAARGFIKDAHKHVSLYIGIPFCVSRCLYCSFSSYLAHKYKKQTGAYIEALIREMDSAARYIKDTGLMLQSVYIGGGTPTALDDGLFGELLNAVCERFCVGNKNGRLTSTPTDNTYQIKKEFTVEAGRPDTITAEKMRIMREHGVTRVSVNPQTLNDETLKRIGRGHTAEDFFRAFALAREYGFIINTDLIMGLPGETEDDVKKTLSGIETLSPDNLTVHTLCVKRASLLKEQITEENNIPLTSADAVRAMLDAAHDTARRMGFLPYYMYRQKNTLGNFENTGYAKQGAECIYNIQITEEKQTILGIGAGAVTKHYLPRKNLIRRIYNVKTPEEYTARIDEMTERKQKLYEYDNE